MSVRQEAQCRSCSVFSSKLSTVCAWRGLAPGTAHSRGFTSNYVELYGLHSNNDILES